MPATYDAEHITSRQVTKLHDFDPDATTKTAVEWRSVQGFRRFLAGLVRTVGSSATTFEIQAATDSSGTGATAVVTHAVGSEPDAVEDQLYLECDIEQIREVVADATHWSAVISFATATDEAVVLTEEHEAQYPRSGLTADIVA